jgi:hypothetical protein
MLLRITNGAGAGASESGGRDLVIENGGFAHLKSADTAHNRFAPERGEGLFALKEFARCPDHGRFQLHRGVVVFGPVTSFRPKGYFLYQSQAAQAQPFTPPSWMPEMSCFCMTTKRMISGTTFITVAAMINSVCWPY